MSNSKPSVEPTTLDIKLFNQSTHYYELKVASAGFPEVVSNDESAAFNSCVGSNDPTRLFDEDRILFLGCFGNQHAEAVVRDMGRVKHWDAQTLREYSMFTIGDFLIVTAAAVYFSVNGDLVIKDRKEGFETVRGVK